MTAESNRKRGMVSLSGIPGAPGFCMAPVYRAVPLDYDFCSRPVLRPEEELHRFKEAQKEVTTLFQVMKKGASEKHDEWTVKIFDSHLFLVKDPEFDDEVVELLRAGGLNAESAVFQVRESIVDMLLSLESDLMRERAADVKDVTDRIIAVLSDQSPLSFDSINRPMVILARGLSPLEISQMDTVFVKGLILETGGKSGHAAIMARSLGIPAVVGLSGALDLVEENDFVILDGESGKVLFRPDSQAREEGEVRLSLNRKRTLALNQFALKKTVTADGHAFLLGSHLGRPEDLDAALANGAEGIGLFRTEFLFLESPRWPDEEQQFKVYKEVLQKMNPHPVTIRTMDIGGDKKPFFADISSEANPFLGVRGIRYSLKNPEPFRVQLRALVRAAEYGNLKILFPMVTDVEELRRAKIILKDIETELADSGEATSPRFETGVMVEVPAAALMADTLAMEVDFFSIGTNDLIQYTMAADRLNEEVADLYQPMHPAVLKLIQLVVQAAQKRGLRTGVCGEMGGELSIIPTLIGLGVDELSMAAPSIPAVRELISGISLSEAQAAAVKSLGG